MKLEKWKKELHFMELGRKPEFCSQALGSAILMKDIMLRDTGHLSECYEAGTVKDCSLVLDLLEKMGGRLIYHFIGDVGQFSSYIWIWEDAIVETELANKTSINITAFSQNEQFILDLQKSIKPLFQTSIKQGHIFAIVLQGSHLSLSNLGDAGIPLVAHNYSKSLIEDYKFVIKDLNSSTPSGRITIMEGVAGTGKTHLIRAMLLDVKDAMFVLVSPDMVSSLGGPELLPLLLNHRHNANGGPIILILEDADKCLVIRGGDNINSIQSLLNLGDGILGSLLDLRIVATTNAKKLELEPAILRPGRLSKRLEVGPLDSDTALGVLYHLLPNTSLLNVLDKNKKYTLAEVYSIARNYGWSPATRKTDENEENSGDPRDPYDVYDEDE